MAEDRFTEVLRQVAMVKNQVPQFAARLRELREGASLTQQELAERAGFHKLTVAKLEQGIREPTWATVQSLARALGVSCEAFNEQPGEVDQAPRPRGRPPRSAPPGVPPAEDLQEQTAAGPGAKKAAGRPKKRKK